MSIVVWASVPLSLTISGTVCNTTAMIRVTAGSVLQAALTLVAILPLSLSPLCSGGMLLEAQGQSSAPSTDNQKPPETRLSERPFKVGERLEFSIQYGPVQAGTASLQISDITDVNGYQCYHISSTAESNKFFSTFFKVRDKVESFMDVNGLFSRRFTKNVSEGAYRLQYRVDFDHDNLKAVYSDGTTFEIAPRIQDVLSALYYVRTLDLKVGDTVVIENHTDKKNYPLQVKVYREEEVDTPVGKFRCLLLEPLLQGGGVFQQKGRLLVWVTDDARKVPVLMKSKVVVGSISAVLRKMNLGSKG
ncbi:MAG: DUF3108 domain-containing protein [Candidatus Eisenbacteria bacterium]|nr:DUF3108 domain-containing protein [Candidatus Eisenbacteria bacterium]